MSLKDSIQKTDAERLSKTLKKSYSEAHTNENTPESLQEFPQNPDLAESTVKINIEEFTHMFMVMELRSSNVKHLLNLIPKTQIGEEEIILILYN